MLFRSLEIRAICDETAQHWQFWAKGSSGCPTIAGSLESRTLRLSWQGQLETALPWFRRTLLRGAVSLGFERLGAQNIILPEILEPFRTHISSFEYAEKTGLLRRFSKPKQPHSSRLLDGNLGVNPEVLLARDVEHKPRKLPLAPLDPSLRGVKGKIETQKKAPHGLKPSPALARRGLGEDTPTLPLPSKPTQLSLEPSTPKPPHSRGSPQSGGGSPPTETAKKKRRRRRRKPKTTLVSS